MIDFSTLKSMTIPDGEVVKITAGNTVLWQKEETPPTPTYTNLAKTFTSGRFNSSAAIVAQDGATTCEDYIQAAKGDVVRIKGFGALTKYRTVMYNPNKVAINVGTANALGSGYATYAYDSSTGIVTLTMVHAQSWYVRFSGVLTGTTDDVIITVNEEIV
jgi:hypothetical protein